MIEAILWIVFTLACVVVSTVILLQEGQGGGLGEAFGGVGQQTFGVKAAGINKFTGIVAGVVVLVAILITRTRSSESAVPFDAPLPEGAVPGVQAPEVPGSTPAPAGQAPAGQAPAGEAPAGGGDGK